MKGKLKKVFQLSQLLTCFISLLDGDNNTNDTNDTKNNDDKISNSFIFNNMKNCYNSYLSMPSLDSQGNFNMKKMMIIMINNNI